MTTTQATTADDSTRTGPVKAVDAGDSRRGNRRLLKAIGVLATGVVALFVVHRVRQQPSRIWPCYLRQAKWG
jgi:hypothetical protein